MSELSHRPDRPGPSLVRHRIRPARRLLTMAAAVGLGTALAGCAGGISGVTMEQPASAAFQDRYPIEVTRTSPTLRLNVSRRLNGLSDSQKAKVHRFLYQFKERGAGRLRVSRPHGGPNQLMAGAVVGQIKQIIDRAGVPREKIIMSVYRVRNRKVDAPVVLSFIRYHAKAAPCGDWSRDLAKTYANRPYPNLGCSTQSNLAAMVANPRDLLRPRKMTPADAIRRENALEQYRKGEVTASKKSDEEKSEVSSVAK